MQGFPSFATIPRNTMHAISIHVGAVVESRWIDITPKDSKVIARSYLTTHCNWPNILRDRHDIIRISTPSYKRLRCYWTSIKYDIIYGGYFASQATYS